MLVSLVVCLFVFLLACLFLGMSLLYFVVCVCVYCFSAWLCHLLARGPRFHSCKGFFGFTRLLKGFEGQLAFSKDS